MVVLLEVPKVVVVDLLVLLAVFHTVVVLLALGLAVIFEVPKVVVVDLLVLLEVLKVVLVL